MQQTSCFSIIDEFDCFSVCFSGMSHLLSEDLEAILGDTIYFFDILSFGEVVALVTDLGVSDDFCRLLGLFDYGVKFRLFSV